MNPQFIGGFYRFDDGGLTNPLDVITWQYFDVDGNLVEVFDVNGNPITSGIATIGELNEDGNRTFGLEFVTDVYGGQLSFSIQ